MGRGIQISRVSTQILRPQTQAYFQLDMCAAHEPVEECSDTLNPKPSTLNPKP